MEDRAKGAVGSYRYLVTLAKQMPHCAQLPARDGVKLLMHKSLRQSSLNIWKKRFHEVNISTFFN